MSENDQNFCDFEKMILPLLEEVHSRESISPPKAQVDSASLQLAMDKNKESLKVKLMTRRPINQLVDQGILPSLKVTPHFFHQRQKLERAKTGDFLKNKIQRRPDRQELIQQHILEDTTVDPSLHDKQRQLKKARLADDLNDRLSHRPGPLELVKGNILQADEKFAQAVKEGQIQFKRTCEGQSLRHPPPSFVVEEDSGSDITLSPPQDSSEPVINGLPSIESMVSSPCNSIDSASSFADIKPVLHSPTYCVPSPSLSSNIPSEIPQNTTTVRIRKKSKAKSQPKPRTIKFHEYKGPPSALKIKAESILDSETSYELLLKQQQLFLQWQLEWQQKYPQMILPVTQKPQMDQNSNGLGSQGKEDMMSLVQKKSWAKLEDMKVSDLKAELKKRNLPVSGSKPQLIERLKPYSDFTINLGNKKIASAVLDAKPVISTEPISVGGIILDSLPTLAPKSETLAPTVVTMDSNPMSVNENGSLVVYNTVPVHGQLMVSRPSSVAPMDIENHTVDSLDASPDSGSKIAINENIVKLQQKRIQELQLELQRSQMQLQQQQWLQQQALLASQPVTISTATVHSLPVTSIAGSLPQLSNLDAVALKKLQQHFQQKMQQQQLLQQLQQSSNGNTIFSANPAAVSAAVKANLAAFIHNNQQNANARLTTVNRHPVAQLQPVVLCPSGLYSNEKPRANSLPNGVVQPRLIWTSSLPNFSAVLTTKPAEVVNAKLVAKVPVDQNDSSRQSKPKQEHKVSSSKPRSSRKSVKSQAVDDVLEILIKNGELPPSAAQVPSTPTTPESQKTGNLPPSFPTTVVATPPSAVTPTTVPPPEPVRHEMPGMSLPSSVLAENATLDFDFQLDLHDIEAMDLGVMDTAHPQQVSNDRPGQSGDTPSSIKTIDMDLEFSDWLDVMSSPLPNSSSNSANLPPMFNYGIDPLMPNMDTGRDNFDMLSLDDMDFKNSSNVATLNWDKVDFAA